MEGELNSFLESCLSKKGVSFYKDTMRELCQIFDADYILIGKLVSNKTVVQSLVYIKENNSFNALNYDLKYTPCEVTNQNGVCVHEKEVAKLYPKDHLLTEMEIESYAGVSFSENDHTGVCVSLSKSESKNSNLIVETLLKLSSKIGTEISTSGVEVLNPDFYID